MNDKTKWLDVFQPRKAGHWLILEEPARTVVGAALPTCGPEDRLYMLLDADIAIPVYLRTHGIASVYAFGGDGIFRIKCDTDMPYESLQYLVAAANRGWTNQEELDCGVRLSKLYSRENPCD
jgi:hypothetical protein